MKIFFYALREYDEQKYVEKFSKQYAFEYGFTWRMCSLQRGMMPYQL